ncbi:MAG: SRPBCC domain-containing protein [Rhizobiales bacterium]|nr:SRPBCC domain-containing protein [Hyphomicrobiales bacterium]
MPLLEQPIICSIKCQMTANNCGSALRGKPGGVVMSNFMSFADRELVVTRKLEYARECVYKAWIDLRLALKWWGSDGYVATHTHIDLRPGGSWSGRFRRMSDGTEHRSVGIIHDVIPYTRIIYTFSWEECGNRGPDTLVTLSFTEAAHFGTKLAIHQRPFRTREEREDYREAWEQTLDRFAFFLAEDQGRPSTAQALLAAE